MKKILMIVFLMLTIGKGYAVQNVTYYIVCTRIEGEKKATISCFRTPSKTDPCVGASFYTWKRNPEDIDGPLIKQHLESSCTVSPSHLNSTTQSGRTYKLGPMGGSDYAKLRLVFDDYPDDTLFINDFNSQIATWSSYSYDFEETASGITYNMYKLDSMVPVDSSTKISEFIGEAELNAYYNALAGGVVSLDDMPNGIFMVKNSDFKIYPNPATQFFNVIMPKNMVDVINYYAINFEIFDMQGKKILSQYLSIENTQFMIDEKTLKTGLYFYKITDEKNHQILKSDKLIVQ